MPRFDPTEFGRLLARLNPQELREVEGLVADARKRAVAVIEIDARADTGGPAASCPRCGGDARTRWGRTRTGAQRWNCSLKFAHYTTPSFRCFGMTTFRSTTGSFRPDRNLRRSSSKPVRNHDLSQ